MAGFLVLWGWHSSNIILRGNRDPLTATPATFGLPFAEESFPSRDGVEIRAWFIPAPAPTDATVIVVHGWGANRSDMLERTHFLSSRGRMNLFYFDFRNHVESGTGRSSLSRYEIGDLEAALAHVRAAHPSQARRVALYGMSMGGVVCLWVAAHDPAVAGVAAESPFCCYNEAIVRYGRLFYSAPRVPFSLLTLWFARRRLGFDPQAYSPIGIIQKISPRPLFLIQGGADARIPPDEGERLFASAGEPKSLWTVPGADHGEAAEIAGAVYQEKLLAFFGGVFAGPA